MDKAKKVERITELTNQYSHCALNEWNCWCPDKKVEKKLESLAKEALDLLKNLDD